MERKRMKMRDPIFGPGEARTAVATFPVKPAGLACTAELWLSRDGVTKDATSGEIPFTSTGVDQGISLPIIMPSNGGLPYQVLVDPKAEGLPLPSFRAIEDVVIAVGPAEIGLVSLEFLIACYEGSVVSRAVYYIPPQSGDVALSLVIPTEALPSDRGPNAVALLSSADFSGAALTAPDNLYEVVDERRLLYRYWKDSRGGDKILPMGTYPVWLRINGDLIEQVGQVVVSEVCTSSFSFTDFQCTPGSMVPGSTMSRYYTVRCTITNIGGIREAHTVDIYHYRTNWDPAYYYPPEECTTLWASFELELEPGEVYQYSRQTYGRTGLDWRFFIVDDGCAKSVECSMRL